MISRISKLEAKFMRSISRFNLRQPERQYRFHPIRRWRFDFAWPDKKLAVEIDGGVWVGGRHVRGGGFIKDCDKLNEAAALGWRVLRFTSHHLTDAAIIETINLVARCLNDE